MVCVCVNITHTRSKKRIELETKFHRTESAVRFLNGSIILTRAARNINRLHAAQLVSTLAKS